MNLQRGTCFALMLLTVWPSASACEMYDRGCWAAKRADVAGLADRNRSCEDMLLDVHNASQQALAHLYARDQVFSPSGRGVDYDNPTNGIGYIDHGDVVQIEREIVTIVSVAIRDVRYIRYDGADLGACARIAGQARQQITAIRDALP